MSSTEIPKLLGIPHEKFNLQHLPKEYQNDSLKEAIDSFAQLAVLIRVTDKNGKQLKSGSGWIISSISINNNDDDNNDNNNNTCSSNSSIHLITGTNLVDHNDVNNHTVSVLFVLNHNTVKLTAGKIMKINKTGNRVRLACPACPALASKVKALSNDFLEAEGAGGVLKRVQKQYGGSGGDGSANGLAVVIGWDGDKRIVVGEVTGVEGEGDFLSYRHNGQIPTDGFEGALTWLVGKSSSRRYWYHVAAHCKSEGGVAVTGAVSFEQLRCTITVAKKN